MNILKKLGIGVLALLASVAALSVASHLYLGMLQADARRQLQLSHARQIFSTEEIREDIACFQSLLDRVHPREIPSFPLGEVRSALTDLAAAVDQPLAPLAFYQEIARAGNMLNDEHTMVFPPAQDVRAIAESRVSLFPFEVEFIDNKLYIARNLSDDPDIQPGMEIVSINELPVDELRRNIVTYYSGTSYQQKLFYAQQNFPAALYLIFGFGNNFDLAIDVSATGEIDNFVVAGRNFSGSGIEEFRYEVIAPDTILFTYNAFADERDQFEDFLQDLFSTARQQDIEHLIIDIRRNQGGSSAFGDEILAYIATDTFAQIAQMEITVSNEVKSDFIAHAPAFVRWFPIQYFHPVLKPLWRADIGKTATVTFDAAAPGDHALHFAGNVYLLIGPGTMSSASLFAATIREYDMGILIGTTAGGYATLYGNTIDVHLPNTGLKVWMPTSVIYGNSAGPIAPDHVVRQTVTDLAKRRDTVLAFAQDLVRSGAEKPVE